MSECLAELLVVFLSVSYCLADVLGGILAARADAGRFWRSVGWI